MGIRVIKTTTRTDITIPWYFELDKSATGIGLDLYFRNTGSQYRRFYYSNDELTQVVVMEFANQQMYDNHKQYPSVQNIDNDLAEYISSKNRAMTFNEEITTTDTAYTYGS